MEAWSGRRGVAVVVSLLTTLLTTLAAVRAEAATNVSEGVIEVSLRTWSAPSDFPMPVPGTLLVRWRAETLLGEPVIYCDAAWLVRRDALSMWADPKRVDGHLPEEVLRKIELFNVEVQAAVLKDGHRVPQGNHSVSLACDVGAMNDPYINGTRASLEALGEGEQERLRSFNVKGSPKWAAALVDSGGGPVPAEKAKQLFRGGFTLMSTGTAFLATARVSKLDVSLMEVVAWTRDREAKAVSDKMAKDKASRIARAQGSRPGSSARDSATTARPHLSDDDFWGARINPAPSAGSSPRAGDTGRGAGGDDGFWDRPTTVETEAEAKVDRERAQRIASLREEAEQVRRKHAEERSQRIAAVKHRRSGARELRIAVREPLPSWQGGLAEQGYRWERGDHLVVQDPATEGRCRVYELSTGRLAWDSVQPGCRVFHERVVSPETSTWGAFRAECRAFDLQSQRELSCHDRRYTASLGYLNVAPADLLLTSDGLLLMSYFRTRDSTHEIRLAAFDLTQGGEAQFTDEIDREQGRGLSSESASIHPVGQDRALVFGRLYELPGGGKLSEPGGVYAGHGDGFFATTEEEFDPGYRFRKAQIVVYEAKTGREVWRFSSSTHRMLLGRPSLDGKRWRIWGQRVLDVNSLHSGLAAVEHLRTVDAETGQPTAELPIDRASTRVVADLPMAIGQDGTLFSIDTGLAVGTAPELVRCINFRRDRDQRLVCTALPDKERHRQGERWVLE